MRKIPTDAELQAWMMAKAILVLDRFQNDSWWSDKTMIPIWQYYDVA